MAPPTRQPANNNYTVSKRMYCDDTSLLITADDLDNARAGLDATYNSLKHAFTDHQLLLNDNKTTIISYRHRDQLTFQLGNTQCSSQQDTKFLGAYLDQKLTWTPHITNLKSKLNSGFFVIRRFSKLGNRKLALLTYHALFASHLSYAIELWGACSQAAMTEVLII